MIVFGVCLMIIAVLVPKLVFLWGLGGILVFIGVILAILGMLGRAVGGRRHYY
jgi:hypothetical protein